MWLQPHDLTISAADEAEGGESRARLCLTRVTTLLLFLGIMRGRRPWPWYCADVFLCLCEELLKVSNTSEHATHRGDRGHRGVKVDLCFALLWHSSCLCTGVGLWRIKQQLLAAGSSAGCNLFLLDTVVAYLDCLDLSFS